MGCNAWNHSWDCNCGWGGDTGYGWQNHPQGRSSHTRLGEPQRRVIRISTTIPNARCPVCGDVVFFYISPFGGRVFFDELGPPWPKHPCTDNPRRSVTLLSPKDAKRSMKSDWGWKLDGWTLLKEPNVQQRDGFATLAALGAECGTLFAFGWEGEARFTADDPVYCRRAPAGTGEFELCYLPINSRHGSGKPETVLVIPHALNADALSKWRKAKDGDADAQNDVGMSLSYGRFSGPVSISSGLAPEHIDWAAAEHWFRASAAGDFWAGHHNLAVMMLRGDGLPKDERLAFHHLCMAAESGEAPSLYRLADLYEHGIGVESDHDEAARLRAVADGRR